LTCSVQVTYSQLNACWRSINKVLVVIKLYLVDSLLILTVG